MAILRDVDDFGAKCQRNRATFGRTHALRVAIASGIQAKSGSLLLRRDDFSAHVCAQVACPTPAIITAAHRILPSTSRANGRTGWIIAPCNPLAIFHLAISVS